MELSTSNALKDAIIALLLGESILIDKKTGKVVPLFRPEDGSQATSDPFKINPVNLTSTHNEEFSIAKHLISKETTIEYKTEGMKQTVNLTSDPVTKLPKFDITAENQPERPLGISSEDGEVPNQSRDEQNAKMPVPTNFSNDQKLQTFANTLAVTIANAVAEATVKIFTAKIEENQTEIEIEFDPTLNHVIKLVNLQGAVVPGQMGAVAATTGTISFEGGNKYKHKAKIKISNL